MEKVANTVTVSLAVKYFLCCDERSTVNQRGEEIRSLIHKQFHLLCPMRIIDIV